MAINVQPSRDESENQKQQPRSKRITVAGIQGWTAIVTSVVAMVISALTWFEVHQRPELVLTTPSQIRIAQGNHIWLYIQPTLSLLERTDVVTGLSLQLRPEIPGSGATPQFTWDETGEWIYDPVNQNLTWKYIRDPAPFAVAPDSPALPTVLFNANIGQLAAGRWEGTLTAQRVSTAEPLVAKFCLEMRPTDLAWATAEGQGRWLAFRNDWPGSSSPCFHSEG